MVINFSQFLGNRIETLFSQLYFDNVYGGFYFYKTLEQIQKNKDLTQDQKKFLQTNK
jgi:hypothetical protein